MGVRRGTRHARADSARGRAGGVDRGGSLSVDISLERLALSALLIALAIGLSHRRALALERALAVGAMRAAVQLVAVGYALKLLFDREHPLAVLGVLGLMILVAAWTAASRVEHGPGRRALLPRALLAIFAGAGIALAPVFVFIVVPTPWYDARYVIPISGMMLSNAMNVVAQTFERLFHAATKEAPEIEALLSLGATPKEAFAGQVRTALRSALTPTINGLVTVGLVALPGMMTGQIVSGTPPEHAVRYQLVIMYQLVAVAAVSGAIAAWLVRQLVFSRRGVLVRRGGR
ncbi:MAG: iron export ABC transporter permease subunit FetB [Polyangiaceae bacterium]